MTESRQNMVVGVFALTSVVVLVAMIFIFGGGQHLFEDTYDIQVHFPGGLNGVQEGQGVTLYGKRVGETKTVEFWDAEKMQDGVKVVVAIEAEYDIPADCEMRVAASIMGFGRPNIEIVVKPTADERKLPRDGSGVIMGGSRHPLDQVVPPHMQTTLENATKEIANLAAALTPVGKNLSRMLESRDVSDVDLQKVSANLDSVIQRFDTVLKNVNVVIGDPQNIRNFSETLANARQISEDGVTLTKNITQISEDGKQTIKDANQLLTRLAMATDDMSRVLQDLDRTIVQMNEGKGTAGLLLNDNRLYEEMVLTARRMSKMIDDFREVLDMAKRGDLRIKAF